MVRTLVGLALWLLSCSLVQVQVQVQAQSLPSITGVMVAVTQGQTTAPTTVAWDYPSGMAVAGFDVYVSVPDSPIPSVITVTGSNVRSTPIPNIRVGQRYYITMDAFDAAGVHSPLSASISIYPGVAGTADPRCVFPTGDRTVSVFPTALQKTGSGGAGSRARLDFQLSSPNSPVTGVVVQAANGGPILTQMVGTDVTALAGMWFAIPAAPGTYALSIVAANAYGCTQTQGTGYSIVVVVVNTP